MLQVLLYVHENGKVTNYEKVIANNKLHLIVIIQSPFLCLRTERVQVLAMQYNAD